MASGLIFTKGTERVGPSLFRHKVNLVLSSDELTPTAEHSFEPQIKRLKRDLYAPLLAELTDALQKFSTDPSSSLTQLHQLQTRLHNELH